MYHTNVNVNLMVENVIQIKSGTTINVDTSVKNIIYLKSIIFGILRHADVKMTKYLANIIYDSVITCYKIIEETKPILTNFSEEKAICKTQNFYNLLAFLLITIALLIAFSIYCYLINYQAKRKYLFLC